MKKNIRKNKFLVQYLVHIGLTIIVFTLGILVGLLTRSERLINLEIKVRAQSQLEHIVKTRSWNSHYGGVYVEKKEGMKSNPYLDDPDILATDGKTYTLKNPALMTREISELFEKDGLMSFHMTSLKPLNPDNRPDEFEKRALNLFEEGKREFSIKEQDNDKVSYRYMEPLVVEGSCLKCHAHQGYSVGDIRGGISVRFDITEIERSLTLSNYAILAMGVLAAAALMGIIYSFTFILMKKLKRSQQKIRELVVTDELTGLYNRRYLFRKLTDEIKRSKRFRQQLGCMMIDIDFFKKVNDQYGHLAGDMIMGTVAKVIKDCCREIDTVTRYGGEEFIVLLPGTDLKGATRVAERIRLTVESLKNTCDQNIVIPVTVSIGMASYSPDDLKKFKDTDQLIRYVDEALFRAKEKGRNRVEVTESFSV